jgi:hypothetical protein
VDCLFEAGIVRLFLGNGNGDVVNDSNRYSGGHNAITVGKGNDTIAAVRIERIIGFFGGPVSGHLGARLKVTRQYR